MSALAKDLASYMSRWKAAGKPVLPMDRACGCGPLEVTVPPAGQQWDSLMTCPDCNALSMTVRTHDSARSLVPA